MSLKIDKETRLAGFFLFSFLDHGVSFIGLILEIDRLEKLSFDPGYVSPKSFSFYPFDSPVVMFYAKIYDVDANFYAVYLDGDPDLRRP